MRQSGKGTMAETEDTLEKLLQQATPRPAPAEAAIEEARRAVKEEWRYATRRNARRRRLTWLAAAASLAAVVLVSMNNWFAPEAIGEDVAETEKSHGRIFVVDEGGQLDNAANLDSFRIGQTVRTDKHDAGIGLRWLSGGSMRLDVDTEIRFVSTNEVALNTGRIYFDSQDMDVALTVATTHGNVAHVGTQYMVSVDKESLVVSVRDGRVNIVGQYQNASAIQGERVTLSGRGQPEKLGIAIYGPDWEWIEAVSPVPDMNGATVYEFLLWVSRETGLQISFESEEIEAIVKNETFRGRVDGSPRIALRQRMQTIDLHYREENGVIIISSRTTK